MVMLASAARSASSMAAALSFEATHATELKAIERVIAEAVDKGAFFTEILIPEKKLEALRTFMRSRGYAVTACKVSGLDATVKLQLNWKE